jgi:hypothetical protein
VRNICRSNRQLESLDITAVGVNNDDLIHIAQSCTSLTELSLRACRLVSCDGVAAIASSCNKLVRINLNGTTVGRSVRLPFITSHPLWWPFCHRHEMAVSPS